MNHGIDSTRSQRKHEQIYRDVYRFRSKESNQQIIPYSRKPTSRHPPPCTPQNEAVLPTLHPPLPENLLHTFRQILPSLPKAPFEHDPSPSTKKKPHLRHSSPQFKENTNIHQSMALRCVAQGGNLNWPFGNQVDWQKGLLTSFLNII